MIKAAGRWCLSVMFLAPGLVLGSPCPRTELSDLTNSDHFADYAAPSAVKLSLRESSGRSRPLGSGTIIGQSGHILTAGHVIPDPLNEGDSIYVRHEPAYGTPFESKTRLLVRVLNDAFDYAILHVNDELPGSLRPLRLHLYPDRETAVRLVGYRLESHRSQPSGVGVLSAVYERHFTATELSAFHGYSGAMATGRSGRGIGLLLGRYNRSVEGDLTWSEVDDHDNGALVFLKLESVIRDLMTNHSDSIYSEVERLIERLSRRSAPGDSELFSILASLDQHDPLALVQILHLVESERLPMRGQIAGPLFHIGMCIVDPRRLYSLLLAFQRAAQEFGVSDYEWVQRETLNSLVNAGRLALREHRRSNDLAALVFANAALGSAFKALPQMSVPYSNAGVEYVGLDLHRSSMAMSQLGLSVPDENRGVLARMVLQGQASHATWEAATELLAIVRDFGNAAMASAIAIADAPQEKKERLARDYLFLADQARSSMGQTEFAALEVSVSVSGHRDLASVMSDPDVVPVQVSSRVGTCDLVRGDAERCRLPSEVSVSEALDASEGSAVMRGVDLRRAESSKLSDRQVNQLGAAIERATKIAIQ